MTTTRKTIFIISTIISGIVGTALLSMSILDGGGSFKVSLSSSESTGPIAFLIGFLYGLVLLIITTTDQFGRKMLKSASFALISGILMFLVTSLFFAIPRPFLFTFLSYSNPVLTCIIGAFLLNTAIHFFLPIVTWRRVITQALLIGGVSGGLYYLGPFGWLFIVFVWQLLMSIALMRSISSVASGDISNDSVIPNINLVG